MILPAWHDIEEYHIVIKHDGEVAVMCDSKVLKHINNSIVNTATGLENASVYKVMLFGSYARQDNTDESDIDYMVILDNSKEDIKAFKRQMLSATDKLSLDNDVVISLLVRDKESFVSLQDKLPLYKNILREGISLYG